MNIAVPIPFIYNMPLKPLSNFESTVFSVTDCNEWYMYNFGAEATEADKAYFGFNDGVPMTKPVSSGMMTQGHGMLSTPCKEVNRTSPYF